MKHLTLEQRYAISVLKEQGKTQKEIAKTIGRDKSVVSRELSSNGDGRSGKYNHELAHRKYRKRMEEKPKHIRFTEQVKKYVQMQIKEDLSPEQIVGTATKEGKECVSHERIYQYLWEDKKQGGKLYEHLRTQGKRYRKRGAAKDKRGMIRNRVPINERPKEVELKQRFGDLEVDTVIGKNHKGALVTINDRATNLTWIKKVKSKSAADVTSAIIELLLPFKEQVLTITADNGKEFAMHQDIAKELEANFYFATPYHSWERGANENMNKLIRQYFPKGMSFETITNQQVEYVQHKLNNRPRKKFNFFSPNEISSTFTKINNQNQVALVT